MKTGRFPLHQHTASLYKKIGGRVYRLILIITIVLTFSAVVLWGSYATNHGQDNDLLAIIGNRSIDKVEFTARYKAQRAKFGLPDNDQIRKEIFDTWLAEELLITEAETRGYDKDAEGRRQREKIQTQELLNAFQNKFISNGMQANDDELRSLFVRFNTTIKVRHLYAPTRWQADSLHAELQNGKSFEELARESFKDPQLRDTGGSLGYFTVDEMDLFFEEAAFTLDIGQISQPIRTAQGYSIIHVQDRVTRPLLTESEYVKRRSNLEQYWRYRKNKEATRAFVDSLRQKLDISFYEPVVIELLQSIRKSRHGGPVAVEEGYNLPPHEQLNQKELVRSQLGVWTVKIFQNHAQFTSEEQWLWIRNEESLEDFIAGLVVREYMLSRAEDLGLHQADAYRTKAKQKMDEYLLKRMEETISHGTIIPEDTLRSYFERRKDQFLLPAKIRLREIVLDHETNAGAIKKQLTNNASFEELAREHSVRRGSAEHDGEIGEFTHQELGRYAELIFPLEIGQWVGPIKMNMQYAFFKCAAKEAGRAQTFAEASLEIEKILKPIWLKRTRQDFLKNIRRHVKVVTYPEKLKINSTELIR